MTPKEDGINDLEDGMTAVEGEMTVMEDGPTDRLQAKS